MSDDNSVPTKPQDAIHANEPAGFDRIGAFLGYMFARHDPGEKVKRCIACRMNMLL
jgi:hypothetical protein